MADPTHITPKSALTDASIVSHFTPSRSRNTSRRTSRHEAPLSSSPHRSVNGSEAGHEVEDTKLSALDPRRFTPTLHANLVAEILNLRREVDNKNGLILGLEEQLVAAEDEGKELEQTLNGNAQETRELRRRLDLLEGGSNTALDKLSQENTAVTDSLVELKRRYEAVQKKLRTREDEVDRMNSLWDSDKQHWEEQKRGLDRKAHVAETRIRTLLQELEHAYAQQPDRRNSFQNERPTSRGSAVIPRPFSRASGARSALSHRRGGSIDSYEGLRFSLDEPPRPTTLAGNSLADELNLGSEDEEDTDGYTSGGALPEERARPVRPYSSQSNHESAKARKLLGLDPDVEDSAAVSGEEPRKRSTSGAGISLPQSRLEYQDVATQWSPPPSPQLQPRSLDTIAEAESLLERDSVYSSKRESIAGSIATLTDGATSPTPAEDLLPYQRVGMVSQACQTIEQPPSPPATPQSGSNPLWATSKPQMSTVSTQTEDFSKASGLLQPEPRPQVPFISVRRPSTSHSRQISHEGPVLPPHTRSAGSQTENTVQYKSASVQTDDTVFEVADPGQYWKRKSRRFSSQTVSTRASLVVPQRRSTQGDRVSSLAKTFEYDTATKQLREISIRKQRTSKRMSEYEDVFADFDGAHGGTDMLDVLDLAELTDDSAASKEPVRKTLTRTESGWKSVQKPKSLELKRRLSALDLMAASRKHRENEEEDEAEGENLLSSPDQPLDSPKLVLEDETGKTTQLSTTIGRLRSPPPTRPPPPIPVDQKPRQSIIEPASAPPHNEEPGPKQPDVQVAEPQTGDPLLGNESVAGKGTKVVKKAREPDMRKMALISSGTSAHMHRPRSPSAPQPQTETDLTLDPPFPVPDRHSSKKLSWQEEPPSPGPGTVTFYGGGIYGRKTIKKKSMTKARSGSATRSPHRRGRKSPSFDTSPPLSPSTFGLSSVTSEAPTSKRSDTQTQPDDSMHERPQLPGHQITRSHGSALESVQGSTSSDTSVVDAIAQTMVGEWMWKYVRRRKSFGLPESAAAEFELGKNSDGNAQRHQRWVWLAPYERAVMWSSKQPTSGPALMGKSGRKLVIQSVLDVRDETPMPKGANQESSFGRSILILTAQRALKFTATSRDRHYIWLTALSFLSHSSVLPQSLNAAAVLPVPEDDTLPPPIAGGPLGKRASQASLQRSKVHDSVRLAKGKKRPSLNPLASTKRSFTTPSMASSSIAPTATTNPPPTEHVLDGLGHISDEGDAAEPPLVPRFATHTRKRSNTGLGVPPARSFRSFASVSAQANASKPSVYSQGTRSENGSHTGGWATDGGASTGRSSILAGMKRNVAKGGSRAGGRMSKASATMSETASPIVGPGDRSGAGDFAPSANFFEAIGTVGMEAFVDGIDKMAADLNGGIAPGRRTRKRDSLTVLRERSRSIDRRRASRMSREQQRKSRTLANAKRDSSRAATDKASELTASLAMATKRENIPIPNLSRQEEERERSRHREKARYEGVKDTENHDMDFDFLKNAFSSDFRLPKTDGDPFVGF